MIIAAITIISSACNKQEVTGSSLAGVEPLVVKCEQKIPEFTLGSQSNLTKGQLAELCLCVWNKLEGWEKETSIALAEDREKDISAMHLRGFPSRFGRAIGSCGGMAL